MICACCAYTTCVDHFHNGLYRHDVYNELELFVSVRVILNLFQPRPRLKSIVPCHPECQPQRPANLSGWSADAPHDAVMNDAVVGAGPTHKDVGEAAEAGLAARP